MPDTIETLITKILYSGEHAYPKQVRLCFSAIKDKVEATRYCHARQCFSAGGKNANK
tara:strand:- start:538 stop:708 length:171 start_codon:yes stop_codon:yes gene_type:complete